MPIGEISPDLTTIVTTQQPSVSLRGTSTCLQGLKRLAKLGQNNSRQKKRWGEIDAAGCCLRLEITKTGRSTRPIGKPARELLQSLPRLSEEWVFPNRTDTGRSELKTSIAELFDAAGLRDARSHDLRRTFGSIAADEDCGDATIAELLGHSRRGVTQRHYIRRPDAALVAAVDRVSRRIAKALGEPDKAAEVVPLRA